MKAREARFQVSGFRFQVSGVRLLALGRGCSIENFQIGNVDREKTETSGCAGRTSESMGV